MPILSILLRLLLCVALALGGVASSHARQGAGADRTTATPEPSDPAGTSGNCHDDGASEQAAGVPDGDAGDRGCCDGSGCACGCVLQSMAPTSAMSDVLSIRRGRAGSCVDADGPLAVQIGDPIRPPIG